MTDRLKTSRCAFVVIKLEIDDEAHYLMRHNPKWGDINFIGGHVNDRDANDLFRTARRELLEEVPPLRQEKGIEISVLTNELVYGPIHSRSSKQDVLYQIRFFLMELRSDPSLFLQALGARTFNTLVPERDLLHRYSYKLSGLVELLHQNFTGGLESIPLSAKMKINSHYLSSSLRQIQFDLGV